MPEGPEIRLAADAVFAALGSGRLKKVQLLLPQLAPFAQTLARASVRRIDTHGKAMLTRFSGGLTMYSHNQLYGRWYTSLPGEEPRSSRTLRVALHTARGSAWLFSATDVAILDKQEVKEHPFLQRLGPDILDASLTESDVVARLEDRAFARRSLGALYLDQGFLAGNGNYLRSEILHFAQVRHDQRPTDLSGAQRRKLARVTLSLARRSYKTRGLTNPPKRVAALKRKKLGYERYRFAVFGRAGQRCHSCGDKVAKTIVGSRRLYFCATCQPG